MNIDFVTEMENVDEAYAFLAARVGEAFEAADRVTRLKWDLEKARAGALVKGEVDGKNEAAREATLRTRFQAEYGTLDAAEGRARWTRHQAELAQLEVERIRLRVRLMELAAGRERQTA